MTLVVPKEAWSNDYRFVSPLSGQEAPEWVNYDNCYVNVFIYKYCNYNICYNFSPVLFYQNHVVRMSIYALPSKENFPLP